MVLAGLDRDGMARADSLVEVAAADADAMRDAAAEARDQAGYFLQPGARGRDDADVAARDDVRKRDRRPGDQRRAAVRAHEKQPLVAREELQRALLFDRNARGEHERVQPGAKRAPRFKRRELGRH